MRGMEDDSMLDLVEAAERLEAVAEQMEMVMEQMEARQKAQQESVQRIVATVDEPSQRELELEQRLAEAERRLAELSAQAEKPAAVQSVRKTVAAGTAALLAKQGVAMEANGAGMDVAALDGALSSLSMEQRFAVKAELLRAGLIG